MICSRPLSMSLGTFFRCKLLQILEYWCILPLQHSVHRTHEKKVVQFRCPNDTIPTFTNSHYRITSWHSYFSEIPLSLVARPILVNTCNLRINAKRLPPNNGSWWDSNREPCDSKTSLLPLSHSSKKCHSFLKNEIS